MIRALTAPALLALLAACTEAPAPPGAVAPDADLREIRRDAEGRCYGRTLSPAIIETVTEQVRDAPARIGPDGAVLSPATFRTVTRQRILRERRAQEFEAVCPSDLTPDLVASLQRALSARGRLDGPVTGRLDGATSAAVRAYQRQGGGPDSAVLSRSAAVELGLVALRRDEFGTL